jgi:kynureninase
VTIAKIYGSSFGLPHPGLLPTKAELDERRSWVNRAVRALEADGAAADGQVAATRRAAKKLAAVARARGAKIVVIDETTVTNPFRRLIEGDVGAELRRKLRKDGVVVEVVPRAAAGST